MSDDMMFSPENESYFSRSGISAASTSSVSSGADASTRANFSRILHALADRGQKAVAEVYGKDVGTISRWKDNGEFEKVAAMLAVLGLKVVPADWQCVDMAQVNALLTLNRAYVINLTADKLVVDLG